MLLEILQEYIKNNNSLLKTDSLDSQFSTIFNKFNTAVNEKNKKILPKKIINYLVHIRNDFINNYKNEKNKKITTLLNNETEKNKKNLFYNLSENEKNKKIQNINNKKQKNNSNALLNKISTNLKCTIDESLLQTNYHLSNSLYKLSDLPDFNIENIKTIFKNKTEKTKNIITIENTKNNDNSANSSKVSTQPKSLNDEALTFLRFKVGNLIDYIGDTELAELYNMVTDEVKESVSSVIAENYLNTSVPIQLPLNNNHVNEFLDCLMPNTNMKAIKVTIYNAHDNSGNSDAINIFNCLHQRTNYRFMSVDSFKEINVSTLCLKQISSLSIIRCGVDRYYVFESIYGNYYYFNLNGTYIDNDNMLHLKLSQDEEYKFFEVKRSMGEGQKSNIWFSYLISEIRSQYPHFYQLCEYYSSSFIGYTNDQVCSILIFACGVSPYLQNSLGSILNIMRMPDDDVKHFSNIMKTCGGLNCELGQLFTELISLRGMPKEKINLLDECVKRIDNDGDTIKVDQGDLSIAIRQILQEEIDMDKYDPWDAELMWARRWAWTKNGAHNDAIKKYYNKQGIKHDIFSHETRLHRREFMENFRTNPLDIWDGSVIASASIKPEVGKPGRVIMGCDTISYSVFNHLMTPIERAWRGQRVLLSPGELGHSRLARKIRSYKRYGGGIHLMLDYDAFDTQHSFESQALAIQLLCEHVHYDDSVKKNMIRSFYNTHIYCDGKEVGRSRYSLMSGHRCTTFINSVLNAAYMRVLLKEQYEQIKSLHTGDDIYMCVPDFSTAEYILTNAPKYNIKMNRSKQSLGFQYAEFLRMTIKENYMCGYLARSIGRAVSGNWEVETPLSEKNAVTVWMTMIWSLSNRSRNNIIGTILIRSCSRATGMRKDVVRDLLACDHGLNGSPVRRRGGAWNGYKAVYPAENRSVNSYKVKDFMADHKFGDMATKDYLTDGITEVESNVLRDGNHPSIVDRMLMASYAKNEQFDKQTNDDEIVCIKDKYVCGTIGNVVYESMSRYDLKDVGVLNKYPLLVLLKNELRYSEKVNILNSIGITDFDDIDKTCFGETYDHNVINGFLSMVDACEVAKYYGNRTVSVTYPGFI